MPRRRIIDPEFWSDQEIGFWSFEARLLYIGTWNFSDDEGRFKAHASLLKSQIFPYDIKINIELLKKEIGAKIQWYDAGGCEYGFIHNFLKYQKIDRPTKSKLPPPPEYSMSDQRLIGEESTSTREHLDPKLSKVKLREGKGEASPLPEKILHLTGVYLTQVEYDKLVSRLGQDITDRYIFKVNNYICQHGKKYKSHYHTILSWWDKDQDHGHG